LLGNGNDRLDSEVTQFDQLPISLPQSFHTPLKCRNAAVGIIGRLLAFPSGKFREELVTETESTIPLVAEEIHDFKVGDAAGPFRKVGSGLKDVKFMPQRKTCLLIDFLSILHVVD
jgi:hypothetical protein